MKRFQFIYQEVDYEAPFEDNQMGSELFVHLPEDARWDEVLMCFAAFVESTGYVGVREKLAAYGVFDVLDALEMDDDEAIMEALEKDAASRNS